MVKKSLIYLFFSILVVLLAQYIQTVLIYIALFYTYINVELTSIFSTTSTGILIRKIVILSVLPALIAGTPALTYRLIKGQSMPYFMELTWFLWLIIVLSKMLF